LHHPVLRNSGLVKGQSVLRIGGIAFETRSALPFHRTDDPSYADFLASTAETSDEIVGVELVRGDPAPPPYVKQIFDTGSAWAAYDLPDGDQSIVMALPAERNRPLLACRFDRGVTRVQVTCSPELSADGEFYNPLRYPLDQLLMMQRLAAEGGAIIHCALIEISGRAIICPGVSGAGKTTLCRQLKDEPDFRILSDDRAVIRHHEDGYWAYGTPWPGEGGFAVNRGRPLAGIGFIQHRETPATERLSTSAAIHRAVRVASLPLFDRDAGPRVFDGLADLCSKVPAWLLKVPDNPSARQAVLAVAEGRVLMESASNRTGR